jgi:hypothetical protein
MHAFLPYFARSAHVPAKPRSPLMADPAIHQFFSDSRLMEDSLASAQVLDISRPIHPMREQHAHV